MTNENKYPGINAHLNSFLQNESGGWANFHAEHITHLREAIDRNLPEGYFARSEKSLQIGAFVPSTGQETTTQIRPDVTVYRSRPPSGTSSPVAEISTPTDSLTILETMEDEDTLTGIVIYQAGEGSVLGRPVTRLELLSPANKPQGTYAGQYKVKRLNSLHSGLRLVEVDYLHQTPPVLGILPDYANAPDAAYPYSILVSDPRPTFEQGKTDIYGFGVLDIMPIINIPLAGADVVKLDFGAVYNHTFNSSRFFRMIVHHDENPPAFERYSEEDQQVLVEFLNKIRRGEPTGQESKSDLRIAEIRKKHPRAYEKWSREEDKRLRSIFEEGQSINAIASQLKRQPGAITSRLRKLGLIE